MGLCSSKQRAQTHVTYVMLFIPLVKMGGVQYCQKCRANEGPDEYATDTLYRTECEAWGSRDSKARERYYLILDRLLRPEIAAYFQCPAFICLRDPATNVHGLLCLNDLLLLFLRGELPEAHFCVYA